MDVAVRWRPGKIAAVVLLIEEHPDACRAVLLAAGHRLDDLDDGRLAWPDACAILLTNANTVGSVLDQALRPTEHIWNSELVMLRAIEFRLRHLEWAIGSAFGAKGEEPEPIPMGGTAAPDADPVEIDEMQTWLSSRR